MRMFIEILTDIVQVADYCLDNLPVSKAKPEITRTDNIMLIQFFEINKPDQRGIDEIKKIRYYRSN
jgi:hypothetical protein